MQKRDKLVIV